MDDLINDFIAETREMLEALSGEIVAWEAMPDDRARLDEIFRFVHTVKGNSGFFDLPRIRALSHAAEDALSAVRSGTRSADAQLVSAVLAIIDRLGELVEALETGEAMGSEDDSALIDALSEEAPAEAAEADTGPVSHAARASSRTVRLPVELLDRMMSGVSDLVLARNELARRIRATGDAEMMAAFDRVSVTVADLRDAITRTRMQRIDNLFAPLPRMVRDISGQTGKLVALEIDGGDVEIDREMLEMIRDPLTHIIRNAIDHGIESPAERRLAGKKDNGCLSVCARQAGNQILLEISDDGAGIDGDKLVDRAIAAGVLTAERAERLGESEKHALVFEAGLSTATEVTDLSGRGVGMDVVRANVERIGGLVEIESKAGQGVVLTLRVPLTLTIIPALTVAAAGQVYAIPRSAIEEIVRVKGGSVRIETVGGAAFATVRDRRLSLVHLRASLGGEPCPDPEAQCLVLLRPAGADLYALAVDDIHDHEELVVKPAAPAVMAAGLYAGTTIADDGKPVLLLDPPGIAAKAGLSLHRRTAEAKVEAEPAAPHGPAALLFRTLEGRARLVPVAAVRRIEDVRAEAVQLGAGRLHVALGETLLPLEGCGSVVPDRPIRLLRLGDGHDEIAYGFADVIDILPLPTGMIPAAEPGEVRGIVLVGEEQAELLDLHWLFARQSRRPSASGAARPVCAIPAGDPFMDAILRPLVESAGYIVVDSGAPGSETASIVIASDGAGDVEPPEGARLVRIRAEAEGEGDSIHRYDREALLAALAGEAPAQGRRRRG
ncbi:MAG: chemotaxis protein CheW [Allosphingosinicella sp.]